MKPFLLDNVLQNIKNSIIESGKEYFNLNKVSKLEYKHKNNKYFINGICNHYHSSCEIYDNKIQNFTCECSQYKYKILCKHVIAILFSFNEKININIKNVKQIDDLNFDEKIIEIYKKILLIDHLFYIEFTNNTFSINNTDFKLLNELRNNISELKKMCNSFSLKDDISLEKVKRILYEYEFISQFNTKENEIYQGDDIDKLIKKIFNENLSYIKIFINRHEINKIKFIDSNNKTITINCEYYKTTFDFILSTDVTLLDFIYSYDFTYMLIKTNDDLILYKIKFDDIKNYKILKTNLFSSKNKNQIESKIQALELLNYFDVKIKNFINNNKNKKIDLIPEYDVNIKKIILHVKPNFDDEKILNQLLIEMFGCYIEKNYNFKQKKFIFNNNSDFDNFISKFSSNEIFNYIYPSYMNNHDKQKIDLKFDVNNDEIKFDIYSNIINSKLKFDQLQKASRNNEKFIQFENDIYLVKNFDLEELEKKFKKYNMNKLEFSNNYIDFKNIFALSKEINDKKLIEYIDKINNYQVELNISDDIFKILKPYQIEGIKWMKKTLSLFNGCVLADEMGLGKTIQTLSLIDDFLNSKPNNKNILIVTPSILLKNWLFEIKKFNFKLDLILLDGNKKNRIELLEKNKNNNKILITTYNQIINDYEYIKNMSFEYLILDEGQRIKNLNSLTSKKIRSLNVHNRLILSGTPIENNLIELWTIFDFILPNFLIPYNNFRNKYKSKFLNQKDIDFLNLQISPFILKRKKIDNLKLPNKEINDIFIKMTKDEEDEYNRMLTNIKSSLSDIDKNDSINILSILTNLRMFCCINNYGSSKKEFLFNDIKKILPTKSKIIVFCFFSSILEKISIELNELGIKNLLLIGKTTNRWKIIDEFYNSECQILLCSLKTGGIGLNLTNANYVYNISPWWNESSENQAFDRVHRMGQEKNVQIKNLLLENSLEIDIYNIKKQKTKLIDNVINDIDYYDLLNRILNKEK